LTSYKLISVAYHRCLFAFVSVAYFEGATDKDCEVDFTLMNSSDWKDGAFAGTCPLSERADLIVGLVRGICLASKELNKTHILFRITGLKFNLVDASELGFATAGYQVVYKALTGMEKYPKVTKEVLEEMEDKLS
jgi:hypothetical protein